MADQTLDLDALTAACDEVVAEWGYHFRETDMKAPASLAELRALISEVERLRANQLPDGGEWVTEYGWQGVSLGTYGTWWRHDAPNHCGDGDNVKRRVWYGPAQPIENP